MQKIFLFILFIISNRIIAQQPKHPFKDLDSVVINASQEFDKKHRPMSRSIFIDTALANQYKRNQEHQPILVIDGKIYKDNVQENLKSLDTVAIEQLILQKPEYAILKYGPIAKNGAVEIFLKKKSAEEDVKIYTKTEVEPTFKGDLRKYIKENMQYPIVAMQQKLEGTVLLSYILKVNNNITDIKVLPESVLLNKTLIEEAIRLLKLTTMLWIPAMQNGEFVNSYQEFKVEFKMNNQ